MLATPKERAERVGAMMASAISVEFQVTGESDHIRLNVSGPNGFQFSKDFAAGKNPIFRLADNATKNIDGAYTYEIVVTPKIADGVKKQLQSAREAGDDAAVTRILYDNNLVEATTQSGTFTIANGAIISPDLEERPGIGGAKVTSAGNTPSGSGVNATTRHPATPLDNVIADDLIVQGSACVGLDCVNNESFGFDTVRLKENNTRLKFDDTSTGTGFPNVDWQLTANDSASGGANKFSIEDITNSKVPVTVTGTAPTNSIFVASTGKVGFRTASPALDLHITTGDTPAIRQEQTNASGFTAQTWDIGANEANWFVRDVTGGSRLPLRIRPGAPTSSVDIAASGNVGIGTASPQKKMHILGASGAVTTFPSGAMGAADNLLIENNGNNHLSFVDSSTGQTLIRFIRDGAASMNGFVSYTHSNDALELGTNGSQRLHIDNAGNIGIGGVSTPTNPLQHSSGAFLSAGGTWTNASSRSFKQDITDLSAKEAFETLNGLTPVKYAYKVDPTERHVGFIAEDVPDMVATKDRKGLSSMDIVAVLTEVVKEQQKTIDELKSRLSDLEKKN